MANKSLTPFDVVDHSNSFSGASKNVNILSDNSASWENGAITITQNRAPFNPTVYSSFADGNDELQPQKKIDGSEYVPIVTITLTNKQELDRNKSFIDPQIPLNSKIKLSIKGGSQQIDFEPLDMQRIYIGFKDFPEYKENDKNKDTVVFDGLISYQTLNIINPITRRPEPSPFYFSYAGAVEGKAQSVTKDQLLIGNKNQAYHDDGETKTYTLYGRIFTDESKILTNNAIDQYVNQRGKLDRFKPNQLDPGVHQLYFTPGSNLNVDNAAKILGYDHFNWYQKITENSRIGRFSNIQFPYTDPPRDSTADGRKTDNYPYYFNEYNYPGLKDPFLDDEIVNNGKTLRFSDQPTSDGFYVGGNPKLKFETYLVGVDPKDKFISTPLYKTGWESNYAFDRSFKIGSGKVTLIQPNISKIKNSDRVPNSHYGKDVLLNPQGGGTLKYSGTDIRKEENRFLGIF
jgi:hypothetical protein